MSKESSKTKQFDSNDGNDEDRYSAKQKSWHYPDQFAVYQGQNRTCCSPADELESMGVEEKYSNNTQSVEVQTDKSALFTLRQEKRLDSGRRSDASSKESVDQNEFLNVKLRKTGLNYEQEKAPGKFPVCIDTQVLDEYSETDDQPMNYALCYNEQNLEEEKKESISKNELLCIEETAEEEKIETIKPKGSNGSKESRNKKDMFSSSRSFKEIFNFFKDRDKKRSHESSKSSSSEGSKVLKTSESYEQKIDKSPQSIRSSSEQSEKESKTKSDYQATQQTPLIFSRCSSLGSLTGIEQNSMNDDRSSIVSDFSHRTSGRVSPSEPPDSPAQLTPLQSNAKMQQKCQIGCFGKKKISMPQQDKLKVCQPNDITYQQTESSLKKLPFAKTTVFEDYLTSFKDESTPTKLHSMAASSLSSLTIDDDDDFELMSKSILDKEKPTSVGETEAQGDRQEPIGKSNSEEDDTIVVLKEKDTTIEEQKDNNREEDDQLMSLTPYEEQLLDECIRRGIAKWTKQNMNDIKPFSWDMGLTCIATKALLASRIRVHSVEILSKIIEGQSNLQIGSMIVNGKNNTQKNTCSDINGDNNNETHSSVNEDKSNNSQMTENSNYSTYEEQLLDQCIRRGIAKITKKNINDIRPFSWDTNKICLTTRAMNGYNDEVYSGICAL